MPNKQEIRETVRLIRESQGIAEQEDKSRRICEKILSTGLFAPAKVKDKKIALYFTHKGEVDLSCLKEYFIRNGGICYFPVTCPDEIRMAAIDPARDEQAQCRTGAMGIREPKEEKPDLDGRTRRDSGYSPIEFEKMDWIFIPGIAFDLAGNRIGYGKGYYDRYLSKYGTDRRPLLVAPAYDFQLVDRIGKDLHDIPVDIVVTDKRIVRVNPSL